MSYENIDLVEVKELKDLEQIIPTEESFLKNVNFKERASIPFFPDEWFHKSIVIKIKGELMVCRFGYEPVGWDGEFPIIKSLTIFHEASDNTPLYFFTGL